MLVSIGACTAPIASSLTTEQPPDPQDQEPPADQPTIDDDDQNDQTPRLSIDDGSFVERAVIGAMHFVVRLEPASAREVTVDYATSDATATAGSDYTGVSGTLTFQAGTTTRTIAVSILPDSVAEEPETFTVDLREPRGARLSDTTATGTITESEDSAPQSGRRDLASLQVTGGGAMYPAFDPDTHHYALTCRNPATLQVAANLAHRSRSERTTLTLLRANPDDNHVSTTGTLDVQLGVNENHDIVIELDDRHGTRTYVVHCLPRGLPNITVIEKTDQVTDGLLLITPKFDDPDNPTAYAAIIDNNGVPRFHRKLAPTDGTHNASNFLRHDARTYSIFRPRLSDTAAN